MKNVFVFILTTLLLASCNTSKFYANKRISHPDSEENIPQTPTFQNSPVELNTTSNDALALEQEQINSISIKPVELVEEKLELACDELKLTNGSTKQVFVKRNKGNYIYFTECNENAIFIDSIEKMKLLEVNYADGRRTLFGEKSTGEIPLNKSKQEKKTEIAAIIVFLLVVLGIILTLVIVSIFIEFLSLLASI